MGFRFQRPLGIADPRVNLWDSGTGIEARGAWSTRRPRSGDSTADEEFSYVIIEQARRPFRALAIVLLMVMLAALAFVVAAQG